MLIPIATLVVLEVFFFRNIIFSDSMMGDAGDARFCMVVTDHWFEFLRGNDSFQSVRMFFPIEGTFGYSDLFLGLAPLYCIARFAGASMYSAFKLSVIVMHATGAFGMYYLLKQKLNLNYFASVAGVVVFQYSNMLMVAEHPQLYAVYLTPFVVIFAIQYYESRYQAFKRRILFGSLFIIVLEIIFYTASYIGYFVFVALLIFLFAFCAVSAILDRSQFGRCWRFLIGHLLDVAVLAILAIVLLIPYLILYLPIRGQFGVRNWNLEVLTYLISWHNLFDVYSSNLLWGSIFNIGSGTYAYEPGSTGYAPLTFILIIVSILHLIMWSRIKNRNGFKIIIRIATGTTLAICLVLNLYFKDGISLWYLLYKYLPGANSMRAICRFNLITMFIGAIAIAVMLDDAWTRKPNSVIPKALMILEVVLCLEYVWVGGVLTLWNSTSDNSVIENVCAPPDDCKTMFIIDNIGDDALLQLISSEIALEYNLNTINGYSSYYPDGWVPINVIHSNLYIPSVENWVLEYDLHSVYAYDLENDCWIKYS